MASSKVMASSSTSGNSDQGRPSSSYSFKFGDLQGEKSKNLGSMNVDEFLRNIYNDNSATEFVPGVNGEREPKLIGGRSSLPNKTADEVWKEITTNNGSERKNRSGGGSEGEETVFPEITLEDYLTSHGAMEVEDVRNPNVVGPVTGFVVDSSMDGRFPVQKQRFEGTILGFRHDVEGRVVGRGKRRVIEEPMDKVAQQRQKRMIKNRESAARSRERKYVYTVELESSVTRLEEENAQLLKEQAERNKERYHQLMKNVIPVGKERKPSHPVLRRAGSAQW